MSIPPHLPPPPPLDLRVEQRLTRLEEQFSLNEDLLDTLNALVATQQERIAALARELQRLRDELAAAQSPGEQRLQDDIPPHY